jgi:FkbM family methyltransferase
MLKKIIRLIYRYFPLKPAIFKLLRKVYAPAAYRHFHFKGWFRVKLGDQKSFWMKHYGFELENEIFWKGVNGWESTSLKIWMVLSKSSEVILDIGANTGIYALISACVNSSATIFAFEPVRRVFEKLQVNIERNNFKIKAFEVALSNNDGEGMIYDQPTDHIYSVTVNRPNADKNVKVIPTKIKTVTLSSFIKEQNLNYLNLIKLDVEMHEPEVLEGFSDISRLRPVLLIEILNLDIGERVSRFMDGYRWFKVTERKGKLSDLGSKPHFVDDNDGYNYLAVPLEKMESVYRQIQEFF